MTYKDALHVLIEHALSDCQGVGTGMRSLPSRRQRTHVGRAIEKVWKQAYGWIMTEGEKSNLKFMDLFTEDNPEAK